MSIPVVSACDLFTKKKKHAHVVAHSLNALMGHELFIPNRPHRHTFYQVMYIKKGHGIHKIDFEDYPFKGNALFFLSPGQVHTILFADKTDVEGVIVNFDDSFFHTFLAKAEAVDSFPFFIRSGKNSYYNLETENLKIQDIFKRILSCTDQKYIRLYLLELFYLIDDFHSETIQRTSFTAAERLVDELHKLIEKNYDAAHYPKFYAQELSVTANHLNAMCKKVVGKSAGMLIRDRIVLESKRLLVNSNLNVKEISYLMGFDDTSYFIKFFKKITGITPSLFRKRL